MLSANRHRPAGTVGRWLSSTALPLLGRLLTLLLLLLQRPRRPPLSWRCLAALCALSLVITGTRRLLQPASQQQPMTSTVVAAAAAAAALANLDKDRAPWDQKPVGAGLLIPRRIHHYFSDSAAIPARLVPDVNSWASNHPDYDIYFWDAGHVERTILARPEYRQYHRYYWNVTASRYERDLIARLLILHSWGGLSVDLSLRSLREATDYLADASCVVAQDRVEKAVFAHGFEALPSVAFLACRPGHHFLNYFLRKVTEVEFRTGAVVLEVATASFLSHVFNAATAAFDEECASRSACEFHDRVTLAEPQVFLPVMEPGLFDSLVAGCRSRGRMLGFLQKEACYNLDVNGNQPSTASLAMPVYVEAWAAENKDQPLLPVTKIGPSSGGRRPVKNWRWPDRDRAGAADKGPELERRVGSHA